jgi:hypothetical protein
VNKGSPLDRQRAVVSGNDLLHNRQSKSNPVGFGCGEEQKNIDSFRETHSDVAHMQIDMLVSRMRTYGEGSILRYPPAFLYEQALESKILPPPDARRQTLDPRPVSYTPLHLAERIRAEQAALEARGASDGERKTITALFADLKGSTALIEGLDPEEARAIIDPALQLMMDAVHGYDGYVAQALGDGIFALFGAPIAHEDHPQRALYAALRMQEAAALCRYAASEGLSATTDAGGHQYGGSGGALDSQR